MSNSWSHGRRRSWWRNDRQQESRLWWSTLRWLPRLSIQHRLYRRGSMWCLRSHRSKISSIRMSCHLSSMRWRVWLCSCRQASVRHWVVRSCQRCHIESWQWCRQQWPLLSLTVSSWASHMCLSKWRLCLRHFGWLMRQCWLLCLCCRPWQRARSHL